MTHEETVRVWFDAWLTRESAVIPEIFAQDVSYVECYGPEYIGRGEVEQWFADWNARGRVLEWSIRRAIGQGEWLAVHWFFRCIYDGTEGAFDGMTLMRFDGAGRIAELREFGSKAEHERPYGG